MEEPGNPYRTIVSQGRQGKKVAEFPAKFLRHMVASEQIPRLRAAYYCSSALCHDSP